MGHALNGSVQDTLIRYHRMKGMRTKWILGTDHAGIATQKQVEKQLEAEGDEPRGDRPRGVRRARLGVARAVRRADHRAVQAPRRDARLRRRALHARRALRARGARGLRRAVPQGPHLPRPLPRQLGPGHAARRSRDLEVEDREETDTLFHIAYPLEDGTGEVVVATVRPETMLADTAIAVNPADERYAHLVGKAAILPLVGRAPADHRRRLRQDRLRQRRAEDHAGPRPERLRDRPPPRARGDLRHRRGRPHDRGRGRVRRPGRARGAGARRRRAARAGPRPRTPSSTRTPSRSASARASASSRSSRCSGSCAWTSSPRRRSRSCATGGSGSIPPSQSRRYVEWMENIRPWCISRQLWWGHQIPVWYRGEEVYAGLEPPEGDGWERDPDVLDTWFSSALWPFATLGWPEETPELRVLLPDRRPVDGARHPVPLGRAHGDDGPRVHRRHPVLATSTCTRSSRRPDGRRMSKSLGTGIDPLDEIERHGADAVRFGLLAMSSTQDVKYSQREGPAGPAPGEQAVQRLALRPAQRRRTSTPRRGRRRV